MLNRWKSRFGASRLPRINTSMDAARGFASELPHRITEGLQEHVTSPLQSAVQHLLDLPSDLMDMVTSEREVPVFLIPTGNGPRDLEIVFDFTEEVSALKSGLLARPVLKVWTGRSDIDQQWFLESFQQEFLEQFEATRSEIKAHLNSETERLSKERSTATSGLAQESRKTVRNSLLMLLGVPFLFDIFLLNWALDSTGKSARHLVDTVKLTNELKSTRRRSKKEMKEIENRFSERGDALAKAIEQLHMQEHPQLTAIHALFNPEPGDLQTRVELEEGIPDVRTAIELNELRQMIPVRAQGQFDLLFAR